MKRDYSAYSVIYVQPRAHYGRVDIYPACELSAIFAQISGKKVLSEKILGLIHLLGFEIKYAPPESAKSEEKC